MRGRGYVVEECPCGAVVRQRGVPVWSTRVGQWYAVECPHGVIVTRWRGAHAGWLMGSQRCWGGAAATRDSSWAWLRDAQAGQLVRDYGREVVQSSK